MSLTTAIRTAIEEAIYDGLEPHALVMNVSTLIRIEEETYGHEDTYWDPPPSRKDDHYEFIAFLGVAVLIKQEVPDGEWILSFKR